MFESSSIRKGRHEYRPDIDGLRALAVFLVVVFHFFPALLPGGFVGVDVFFVISGYLIAESFRYDGSSNWRLVGEFYRRRVIRLMPALLLVILICGLIGFKVFYFSELNALGKHIIGGLFYVSNFVYAFESGYFDSGVMFKPLLHLWSLGVEAQFYVLFPLLVLGFGRYYWGAVFFLLVASFSLSVVLTERYQSYSYYLPFTRIWELFTGVIIFLALRFFSNPATVICPVLDKNFGVLADIACGFGILLIFVSSFYISGDKAFPGYLALMPVVGAGLVILFGKYQGYSYRILSTRGFVWLGSISYPFYLWHWPILCFLFLIVGQELSLAQKFLGIGIAVALSQFTHRYIERPLIEIKDRERTFRFLAYAVGVFACLGVGFVSLPVGFRGSPDVQNILIALGDWGPLDGTSLPSSGPGIHRRFGADKVPGKILVVGDSHAEQFWPIFTDYFATHEQERTESVEMLSRGGCLPLASVERIQIGHRCREFGEQVDRVLNSSTANTIVFIAAWESYIIGDYGCDVCRPLVENVERSSLKSGSRLSGGAGYLNIDWVFEDFEYRIADLMKRGKKVYIVLSNVSAKQFDPRFMIDRVTGDVKSTEVVLLEEYERYRSTVRERLDSIAVRTGAVLLDPSMNLCRDGTCETREASGSPIYSDTNHLRPTFVKGLGLFDIILGKLP